MIIFRFPYSENFAAASGDSEAIPRTDTIGVGTCSALSLPTR